MLDCLVRKGIVIDGSGGEPVEANVGIRGDRIVYIGRDNPGSREVIDAEGLCVCPGFIDSHAHSEFTILADGRAEGKLLQGVTTEINGNCGLSAAPLYGEAAEQREQDLKEMGIKERWSSFGEYFRILESRGTAVNFATLCGHGNVRASVMGFSSGAPDRDDLARMKKLLADSLREGARGLSTGLIYPPGVYSETGELVELSRVLSSAGGAVYTSHMRSEGNSLVESVEEVIRIAREAPVNVHVSHIKTAGSQNWWKAVKVIELMESVRREGVGLTCDRYPYIAAGTDLDTLFPSWVHEGGVDEELRRLRDPEVAAVIKSEIGRRGDEYWKGVYISSVASPEKMWMEGENIYDICSRLGKRAEDFVIDIVVEEQARVGAIFFSMNEDNLRRFLSLPYTMVGSDSSVRSMSGPTRRGRPHPRGFGTFPRFIGRYVRNEGLVGLPEAIRKITSLPARTFGLKDRGLIKEGFYADIAVFDYERIIDRATFKEPYRRPEGLVHVFVNGELALREGRLLGTMPGRVLR